MHHVFLAILRGPYWLQFVIAAGLIWLGYTFQTTSAAQSARESALLHQPAPVAVPIADMQQSYDSKVATEVAVTAQLALDRSTRLIRKTNFITTSEEMLYILVDADATPFTAVARGAIVVDASEVDRVATWVSENTVDIGAEGFILDVTGVLTSTGHTSMAYDAIEERGLERGPDFFFIRPHFEGRVAALTPKPYAGFMSGLPVYLGAAFFVLLGLVKRAFDRSRGVQRAGAGEKLPAGLSGQQLAERLIADDMRRAGHVMPTARGMADTGALIGQGFAPPPAEQSLTPAQLNARITAAMANPLVGAVPKPAAAPDHREVFQMPPPSLASPPPIRVATPISESLHRATYSFFNSRTVGLLGLVLLITAMLWAMSSSDFEPMDIGNFTALTGSIETAALWVIGLLAVALIIRNYIGASPASQRKDVYDPYLRLAERERNGHPR
jgi:hypothetical protein